jgi:hypothetical protein
MVEINEEGSLGGFTQLVELKKKKTSFSVNALHNAMLIFNWGIILFYKHYIRSRVRERILKR